MLRRLLRAGLVVLALLFGAATAAVIVAETAWFKDRLRIYIVHEANQYLNGQMTIGRLGGNLISGIEMENIEISMNGTPVVTLKDLGVRYSAIELISKGLSVRTIRLNGPVVHLQHDSGGWSIRDLIKRQASEADRQGPVRPISLADIGISGGTVVIDGPQEVSGVDLPRRFEQLDAKLSFHYEPVHYTVDVAHVSFRGAEPSIGLNSLSGQVAVHDDAIYFEKVAVRTEETSLSVDGAVQNYLTTPIFKLQISSDKTSLPEIANVVPALAGIRLQPAYELKLDGPADRLGVELNVRSTAGDVAGKIMVIAQARQQTVSGDVSVRHLDLSPIARNERAKSDITADMRIRLTGPFSRLETLHGTVALRAPRIVVAGFAAGQVNGNVQINGRRIGVDASAAAYAAAVTVHGYLIEPRENEGVAYDLRGKAQHVDLRRLPRDLGVPPAPTSISGDYRVAGTAGSPAGPSVNGDLRFDASTVSGARVAAGSTAGVSLAAHDIQYRADATVAHLDLERLGRDFKLSALAQDRYLSTLNGHVTANGRGTDVRTMDLTANGTLADSSILGGRISSLTFDATVAHDALDVKANGTVADVDPAVATGKPAAKGRVGGAVDVQARFINLSSGTVTPDSLEGSAKIALEPSTVGAFDIDRATLDADYRHSTAQIRTFELAGRDLNVAASGTLALDDTGQSNLTFRAGSSNLEEIGRLTGQPITGIARTDGTVTGNRTELQASGNLVGDGVRYENNGALTLATAYTVKIPRLSLADAQAVATTNATFVTIAGQDINELTAKTEYDNKQLAFDASARQPQRSLVASGSLLVHLDHREVHLQRLALQTQGLTWQTTPATQPTIRFAGDSIDFEGLIFVNAAASDQQIVIDGAFGQLDDALKVKLENVEIASVEAILLRPPRLSGRLSATATVTGTKDAPHVAADFQVAQGGFRQFRYDTLAGTVGYAGKGVTLDARLQQNASAWLTAKGYVPRAAFNADLREAHAHRELPPADDRIDLHIDSSPIDLGFVQGFTDALTNVTGTVQAKVDVTGAADDPHPTGVITIQNAAFIVDPTGVAYRSLEGQIELQPDRLHVSKLTVLDDQQQTLSVTGDLAVHELNVGGFNVELKANDFKLVDNKMAKLRVKSDVRLTGDLQYPRVEGDLMVSAGQINLDQVLASVGESAYSTKPIEYQTEAVAAPAGSQAKPVPSSAFETLQMDLNLTLPNGLLLKGNDLNAGDVPIGLGALNVTLGGDLWVGKRPWDQIRLVGVVNTVRGTYDFQGRRFTILRDGTVRFEGLDELDPALDLRAQRLIQGVEANVNIRGTLHQPEVVLSSSPPLDQADILALIVFNQPINQLGEGQQISLAQRAEALAAGAAAGELSKSIGEALNLDTFDIQLAPDSGATAEVTVGQQIGQNLYVKVQEDVGDISMTNFIVEYELTNWLRLQSNLLQGASTQPSLFRRAQGSGFDLIFFLSY